MRSASSNGKCWCIFCGWSAGLRNRLTHTTSGVFEQQRLLQNSTATGALNMLKGFVPGPITYKGHVTLAAWPPNCSLGILLTGCKIGVTAQTSVAIPGQGRECSAALFQPAGTRALTKQGGIVSIDESMLQVVSHQLLSFISFVFSGCERPEVSK